MYSGCARVLCRFAHMCFFPVDFLLQWTDVIIDFLWAPIWSFFLMTALTDQSDGSRSDQIIDSPLASISSVIFWMHWSDQTSVSCTDLSNHLLHALIWSVIFNMHWSVRSSFSCTDLNNRLFHALIWLMILMIALMCSVSPFVDFAAGAHKLIKVCLEKPLFGINWCEVLLQEVAYRSERAQDMTFCQDVFRKITDRSEWVWYSIHSFRFLSYSKPKPYGTILSLIMSPLSKSCCGCLLL